LADRITTLHPDGKAGANIEKDKYDTIKHAIIETVREHPGITFGDLTDTIREQLQGTFDGSIPWYVTTVKLDLEARGVIERVEKSSPQQLQMTGTP